MHHAEKAAYCCNDSASMLLLSAYLVGVLHDEVFALLHVAADVDDAPQDAPAVLHAQVDLVRKLVGFKLLRAQDDVLGGVAHMHSRDVPINIIVDNNIESN